MSHATLIPRSAFAGLMFHSASRPNVLAWDLPPVSLASVAARRAQVAELRRRALAELGVALPEGPRRVSAGFMSLVGTGPVAWLAIADRLDADFHIRIGRTLGPCASVADQSGAHALLRLSGAQIRSTLGKMLPIDLHPRSFAVGAAATAAAAQIPVHLWRLEDGTGGHPVFEIAVPRSLAVSFWYALTGSAAEFGLALNPC